MSMALRRWAFCSRWSAEARIGQKNGIVRQWAQRGTRPRQPADQRYDNAWLFGAICPARGVGAACEAWRSLTENPETITSIGRRQWAHIGHS